MPSTFRSGAFKLALVFAAVFALVAIALVVAVAVAVSRYADLVTPDTLVTEPTPPHGSRGPPGRRQARGAADTGRRGDRELPRPAASIIWQRRAVRT